MDSKGHLFYAGNFELFTNGKDIFKAPKDCPVDIYGYRQGASESIAAAWNRETNITAHRWRIERI